VKRVNVDYYTDAIRYTQVRVLEIAEEEAVPRKQRHHWRAGPALPRARRRAGEVAGCRIQEDQVLHQ
jgi:hypothetical protein